MAGLVLPAISITASSIVALAIFYFAVLRKGHSNADKRSSKVSRSRDRGVVLRSAKRRLTRNPKDSSALLSLAELYYEEQDFESSYQYYQKLTDLCAIEPGLDEFEITLRHAMSALKTKKYNEAYNSFAFAKSLDKADFDLDNNLGYLEYLRKNYQRAESLLRSAKKLQPEALLTCKHLGLCCSKLGKFKEAVSYLSQWLESQPEDKESRFVLAKCYFHLTQFKPAEHIFKQLRADPQYGAQASLYSGTIHMNNKSYENAIMDFEVGLRQEKETTKLALELKYRLAAAYVQMENLNQAVVLLRAIWEVNPNFRDVGEVLKKYQELSTNQSFRSYLMATASEFSNLCRNIAQNYFEKASTRIMDISSSDDDCVDILTEVVTRKWEDVVIFRLMRNNNNLGDLAVRDFYIRMKDLRAGRGIFITAGTFNKKAEEFVEARLIDLLDKESLLKQLKKLSSR